MDLNKIFNYIRAFSFKKIFFRSTSRPPSALQKAITLELARLKHESTPLSNSATFQGNRGNVLNMNEHPATTTR